MRLSDAVIIHYKQKTNVSYFSYFSFVSSLFGNLLSFDLHHRQTTAVQIACNTQNDDTNYHQTN